MQSCKTGASLVSAAAGSYVTTHQSCCTSAGGAHLLLVMGGAADLRGGGAVGWGESADLRGVQWGHRGTRHSGVGWLGVGVRSILLTSFRIISSDTGRGLGNREGLIEK